VDLKTVSDFFSMNSPEGNTSPDTTEHSGTKAAESLAAARAAEASSSANGGV
jgi:hypothetical protein